MLKEDMDFHEGEGGAKDEVHANVVDLPNACARPFAPVIQDFDARVAELNLVDIGAPRKHIYRVPNGPGICTVRGWGGSDSFLQCVCLKHKACLVFLQPPADFCTQAQVHISLLEWAVDGLSLTDLEHQQKAWDLKVSFGMVPKEPRPK